MGASVSGEISTEYSRVKRRLKVLQNKESTIDAFMLLFFTSLCSLVEVVRNLCIVPGDDESLQPVRLVLPKLVERFAPFGVIASERSALLSLANVSGA